MKSLTDQTISGFLWIASGSGVQALLKIGIVGVLARFVSPEEFGLISAALVVVGFSAVFSELGVSQALIQKPNLERRHLITGFSFSLVLGICFWLLLLNCAELVAGFFRMPALTEVLPVIGIVFILSGVSLVSQALLLRNLKFKTTSLIGVASYAFGYGFVSVLLALQGFGVWALVYGLLVQSLVKTVLSIATQSHPIGLSFDYSAFKELLYFGSGTTVARVGSFLASQGDNLVVGRVLGAAALGLYSRAYTLMVMPVTLFGGVLNKVLFPAMAKVLGDQKRLKGAYLSAVGATAFIAIPVSVMVVHLGNELIMILLGSKWLDAVQPLQILAIGLLFRMSYKTSDALTKAVGAVYRRAWRQLVFALLVIVFSYVGSWWGLKGVSVGVVLALFINYLLMAQLSLKLTDISWLTYAHSHLNGIILGAFTAMVSTIVLWTINLVSDSPLFNFISCTILTGGILGVLIYFFPRLFFSDSLFRICGLMSKAMLKRDVLSLYLGKRMNT